MGDQLVFLSRVLQTIHSFQTIREADQQSRQNSASQCHQQFAGLGFHNLDKLDTRPLVSSPRQGNGRNLVARGCQEFLFRQRDGSLFPVCRFLDAGEY